MFVRSWILRIAKEHWIFNLSVTRCKQECRKGRRSWRQIKMFGSTGVWSYRAVCASGLSSPRAPTSVPHAAMSGLNDVADCNLDPGLVPNPITAEMPTSEGISNPLRQPAIGKAEAQTPSGAICANNLIAPIHIGESSGSEGVMPKFSRRRSAPSGQTVATGEVDAEMYDRGEKDSLNMKDFSTWLKAEKEEAKDEPWNTSQNYHVSLFVDVGNSMHRWK